MSEQIEIRAGEIVNKIRDLVNEDGHSSMHGTIVPIPYEALQTKIEEMLSELDKAERLIEVAKKPKGKGMHNVCYCCENLTTIRDMANEIK